MKFNILPKLRKEDLASPTLQKLIDKLLPTFNDSIDQSAKVLNGNVSIKDNVAGMFIEYPNVKGAQLAQLKVSWTRKDKPLEIRLCQLKKISSGVSATASSISGVGRSYEWHGDASTIPSDSVEQDGRALLIATHIELFNIIGTNFNTQTNPETGTLMSDPGDGYFRVPNTKGLFTRHAGNSRRMVSGAGSLLSATALRMVSDDATAKNGLTATLPAHSGSFGSSSDSHTHTGSGTSSASGGHSHTMAGATGTYGNNAFPNLEEGQGNPNIPIITGTTSSVGNHTHTYSFTTSSDTHTHTTSVSFGALTVTVNAGDTETRVRNRGVLKVIQIKPTFGSQSTPLVDPFWTFDGKEVSAQIFNIENDAFYMARIFIQA